MLTEKQNAEQFSVLNEVIKSTSSNIYAIDKVAWVMWSMDTTEIINGKKHVRQNNTYPDWFIWAISNSGLYYRIHQTMSNMIAGTIEIEGGNSAAALQFLEDINGIFAMQQMAYDAALFNGIACQVSYLKKRVAWLYPEHFHYVRQDKENSKYVLPTDQKDKKYWISAGWDRVDFSTGKVAKGYTIYTPQAMSGFAVDKKATNDVELYYDYMRNSNTSYYPHPDGGSLIDAIELDAEIPKFHRENLKNSISANFLLSYPKNVNEDFQKEMEERREIAKTIKEGHAGAANAGKGIIAFYEINAANKAEVTALPTDSNDKKFEVTYEQNMQRILTGLGVVAPENFGILTTSGFSPKADTFLIGQELLIYNVVNHKKRLIETFFEKILLKSGFGSVKVRIVSNTPIFTDNSTTAAPDATVTDTTTEVITNG